MRVTKIGENTTLAQIINLVDDATSSKAPIAKIADKISAIFVPIVITLAIIATIIWLFKGESLEFALSIGICVLVISCPCALGLATPTAIMVGTGKGASLGILSKSAQALETLHNINTVVLDKTGTITQGKPQVTDIYTSKEVTLQQLLTIASSLEKLSEHPLGEAILQVADKHNISTLAVENFKQIAGQGLSGIIDNSICLAGNQKLLIAHDILQVADKHNISTLAVENFKQIAGQGLSGIIDNSICLAGNQKLLIAHDIENEQDKHNISTLAVENFKQIAGQGLSGIIDNSICLAGNQKLLIAHDIENEQLFSLGNKLAQQGKTPLYFTKDDKILGLIAIADTIKATSPQAIQELKNLGINIYMLTGDNQLTAKQIAKQINLEENNIISDVLPQDKEAKIRQLQNQGQKVAMVGDGINDAPALARADVGIAIGAGTDIAIDSADIILMKNNLLDVVTAIKLSKAVIKNIRENLFWAFIYNIAIQELKNLGINIYMLTGDNQLTAKQIAKQINLEENNIISDVLPQDKETQIRQLQNQGQKVAMVGDGINDAPALARADVGIAIGAGTDIAIDSADIILMKNNLLDVVTAIKLSKAVIKNIRENLFWAFIYNIIGIPIAMGLFYTTFGLKLNPMIGALAMSFSSVFVVTNALRLRFFQNNYQTSSINKDNSSTAINIQAIDLNTSKGDDNMGLLNNLFHKVFSKIIIKLHP